MASCPKCGKPKIKKRNGVKKCKHCGFLPEPHKQIDQIVEEFNGNLKQLLEKALI